MHLHKFILKPISYPSGKEEGVAVELIRVLLAPVEGTTVPKGTPMAH